MKFAIIILTTCIILFSCGDKPKVIAVEQQDRSTSTGIFSDPKGTVSQVNNTATQNGIHTIVVKETLPTDKYTYMRVDEDGEEYWVASSKQKVEVGGTYFFQGGLLKRNFTSKEYNRVFDKVYLVSKVVPVNHGGVPRDDNSTLTTEDTNADLDAKLSKQNYDREGSIKINDLINHPKKYEGKRVQLTGICTKLNANIMGRNWIHLKDGSADDYDLVLTSSTPIPQGHVVTMAGEVVLDRDFGAGYRYDLIIENAEIVK